MATSSHDKKRHGISLKRKIEIIEAAEKQPSKNKTALAANLGVPRTTLLTVLKEKGTFESKVNTTHQPRDLNR